jgi:hypothetical protein
MHVVLLALVGLAITGEPSSAPQQPTSAASSCRPSGSSVPLAELSEASGIAVSRRVPGRLWAINDSEPTLYALDSRGSVTGRMKLSGVAVDDWEAIAVGPCPAGSCLYIGDIGDNRAKRNHITVYRVSEPGTTLESTAAAEALNATYPDGPQDAEALLVGGDGTLFVVTKGETGPIALYRFPAGARPGASVRLERVAALTGSKVAPKARITDGAVSPDGRWVALRTGSALAFYRAQDLLAGKWQEADRVNLAALHEPQGEGVALAGDNTVFVVSEGGGRGRGGTFARFSCTPR